MEKKEGGQRINLRIKFEKWKEKEHFLKIYMGATLLKEHQNS